MCVLVERFSFKGAECVTVLELTGRSLTLTLLESVRASRARFRNDRAG
jgi:hypothetical protein